MFKKVTCIWLLITMIFMLGACETFPQEWTLLASVECCDKKELSSTYLKNIAKSTQEYEVARANFITTEGRYTDDFGGVFIDAEGFYNINVVGSRKPIKSDFLIYRRVANSYNFLKEIYDETSKLMREYSIWEVAICESCNRIRVCLGDESKIPLLVTHLAEKNLFRGKILNVFIGKNQTVSN